MTQHSRNVKKSAEIIQQTIKGDMPRLAIILGSGLGSFADKLENAVTIPYKDLPGFPVLTVEGHSGDLVAGELDGVPLICLKGRVHTYEIGAAGETSDFLPLKTMIRTLKAAGVETLMTTSSCGSLHDDMPPGSIMAIMDHINLMGINPLLGENEDEFGPRFPAMTGAWNKTLRAALKDSADKIDLRLYEGVLAAFRGPCFETPAEIRMARTIGADAVGMSAVPECILAVHCGLSVLGCAVITNMAAGMRDETLSHEHTLSGAKLAHQNLTALIEDFVVRFHNTALAAA
ncbi:MAG: purine-nucleoside phosphorylase [Pseudomonadota bacterium]|jgi:xanthosine phosphorylase|nr:purine-nucleoside phosphorylase [Pseudomonadota bacterium]QKK04339.1 MAG: purine-nucleoside phosphorylase [Pseudomonadota bacterium]